LSTFYETVNIKHKYTRNNSHSVQRVNAVQTAKTQRNAILYSDTP